MRIFEPVLDLSLSQQAGRADFSVGGMADGLDPGEGLADIVQAGCGDQATEDSASEMIEHHFDFTPFQAEAFTEMSWADSPLQLVRADQCRMSMGTVGLRVQCHVAFRRSDFSTRDVQPNFGTACFTIGRRTGKCQINLPCFCESSPLGG